MNSDVITVVGQWKWPGDTVPSNLLSSRERATAMAFPPWRCAEWTWGRLTAHAALVIAGIAGRVEILRGEDGSPQPDPPLASLSISHTRGYVAVALSRTGVVGVDVEIVDARNEILRRRISSGLDNVPRDMDATLLFSCKEAMQKAHWSMPGGLRSHSLADYPIRTDPGALTAWYAMLPGAVVVTVSRETPAMVCIDAPEILRLLRWRMP